MTTSLNADGGSSSGLHEKKWLVIYTRPRWEKKVDKLLAEQEIESYCPVRRVINQWADRKKEVLMPLFNSYVFVKIDVYEHSKVLYTLGVIGFVYYMGKPAVVRECVIDDIRSSLNSYHDLEIVNLQGVSIGDNVKINDGVLVNQSGTVTQINGKNVLMVIESINCALVTRIALNKLTIQN